jgi:CheY-like chemotaxis protein
MLEGQRRAESPGPADIPIVITSGYFRAEDIREAESLGLRAFLVKPDTVEELGRILNEEMSRTRGNSAAPERPGPEAAMPRRPDPSYARALHALHVLHQLIQRRVPAVCEAHRIVLATALHVRMLDDRRVLGALALRLEQDGSREAEAQVCLHP